MGRHQQHNRGPHRRVQTALNASLRGAGFPACFAGMNLAALTPPIPGELLQWQSSWGPRWRVLDPDLPDVMVPDTYAPGAQGTLQHPQGVNYWAGVLEWTSYILEWCDPMLSWPELRHGNGLQPNPRHAELHTECCIFPDTSNTWLASQRQFRLQPHGKHSGSRTSKSRGYIRVMPGGFVDNTSEFYLHTFLCYAYYGPPPADMVSPVAGHLCHHKLCLCPWHLVWMEQATNVRMARAHASQADYA